jgi:integrase
MELMLWTAQRRVDAIHLGRQHIRDGRFEIRQTKGAKAVSVMIARQLADAIDAMAPADVGDMVFLVNDRGKPFTNAGFGNKMREWCDSAGLPQCTAHGLRKAAMRRMAELGLSNQTMKAVSGHTKDDEVARYTAAANARQLGDGAITQMSNHQRGLDARTKQGIDNA